VSARPVTRDRPADAVAGLLAACSIFASLVALAYRPARITPFTIGIALVAVGIGGRNARLAALAVAVGSICFVLGMTIAVLTENPIF
jgi:hypothetical protein